MRVSGDFIIREIAGEHILIPVGQAALHIHGMINLTESGVLLWQRLQQDTTEDQLVEAILAEYDIDSDTARSDVREFLDKLRRLEILQEAALG